MIRKMSKVRLVGQRAILPNVLDEIYRYGKMHIEKVTYPTLDMQTNRSFALKEMALGDDEMKEMAELENLLGRVEELLKELGQIPDVRRKLVSLPSAEVDSTGAFAQKRIDQIRAVVNKIEEQKEELYSSKFKAEGETEHLLGFGNLIETFASLMEQSHDISNLEIVGFTVDKSKKAAIELLKEKLHSEIADEYEIFTSNLDRRNLACMIATNRKNMLKIRGIFAAEGIQEISLPEEFTDKSLKEIRAILQDKSEDMPTAKKEVDTQIKEFGLKNIERLKKIKCQLQDRVAFFGEVPKFAETKFTFIMHGWLPSENLPKFKEMMQESYKSAVVVDEEDIEHEDKKNIPVTLQNRALVRPFERIMAFFDPPAYGTIDPTCFLAIFFPMIFGMILGDIFYGLLLLIPTLWLWRTKKLSAAARDISYVFMICAISTILFGIFYGEFMGNLGHVLGLTPVVNREHGITASLAMAVGFGAFHILLSFVLKGVGAYREHHSINKHVVEAASFVLLILATVAVAMSGFGILPKYLMNPALGILGISVVMIVVSGGLVGGIEIFGTMGNILSYARIMAIGLASVIMAVVANKMATDIPNVAVGVFLAIMLHSINLVLGVFGPTIHGLRLHVVESFQKFAKFEGRAYKPFKRES